MLSTKLHASGRHEREVTLGGRLGGGPAGGGAGGARPPPGVGCVGPRIASGGRLEGVRWMEAAICGMWRG
jgi:hypothetical protein